MPGVFQFSLSAANNADAVPSISWAEGQAPSSLNDSARAEMAAVACYRDDISGSIVTSGTSTAYIVSSNQGFDTLAHFNDKIIAFTPHTTNGAGPVTCTVDGFANLPLRSAPNTELLAGVLIQGTSYVALFNQTDNALYLQSFYGNPFNIPLGGSMDYWLPSTPNSAFAFPFGQAISRTTYATLFAGMGTTFGTGDGTTTFNIPDLRGRVVAGVDNMGGAAAGRLTSASNMGTGLLGQSGGAETETLTIAQMPAHTHANTLSDPGHSHSGSVGSQGTTQTGTGGQPGLGGNNTGVALGTITINSNTTGITIANASQGGGGAHPNVMPAICANKIMRII